MKYLINIIIFLLCINSISFGAEKLYLMQREDNGKSTWYTIGITREMTNNPETELIKYTADKIETITIQKSLDGLDEALDSWDISKQNGDVYAWTTSGTTDGLYNLYIGGNGDLIMPTNSSSFFREYTNLTEINGLELLDTSSVSNMSNFFRSCSAMTQLDISSINTSNVTTINHMFYYCSNLQSINLENINTSKITSMENVFGYCSSLQALDLSGFDTSNVTTIRYMFIGCSSIENLDLSFFDTTKVTRMDQLFNGCKNLKNLNISSFDTSKVQNFSYFFQNCASLTSIDLSNIDTASSTSLERMFYGCNKLTTIDVSNFDTSNVTSMYGMFGMCTSLTELDLSNFNTENVTNMKEMFFQIKEVKTLDLSSFNLSKVTDMTRLFIYCTNLETLILGENFDKITGTEMFANCGKLTRIIVKSDDVLTITNDININKKAIFYVKTDDIALDYAKDEDFISLFGENNERVKPILEIVGNSIVNIQVETEYVDKGALVANWSDEEEEIYQNLGYNLVTKIEVKSGDEVSNIDTTKKEDYIITYTLYYTNENDDVTKLMDAYRNVSISESNIIIKFNDEGLYNGIINNLQEDYEYQKIDDDYTIEINSSELEKIKELKLNNLDIADITGLEKFTSLTKLNLRNNYITSISNLTTLKSLETLDVSHCQLLNTNGIEGMTKLIEVNLYDNYITDFEGLRNIITIEKLIIGENNEKRKLELTNLDALSTLTNLTYLDFSENACSDIIDYISNLTKLTFLNIQDNYLTSANIEDISNLINLEELILYGNNIDSITPLLSLNKLKILKIQKNKLKNLDGIIVDDELVWPELEMIGVSRNSIPTTDAGIIFLIDLYSNKEIILDYEYNVDTTNLPHIDTDGTLYVTYEDFKARCDGVFDDYIALNAAHIFATNYMSKTGNDVEVRATEGKIYHIFKEREYPIYITQNTDWNNATFIIHDEDIEEKSGRFVDIFNVTSIKSKDTVVIENPTWTIDTTTKKLTEIDSTLATLNAKGYKRYCVRVENANKINFIRNNNTTGSTQRDIFMIDSEGNLLNDVQWDFDELTKVTINGIFDEAHFIKNARFVTNAFNDSHELIYSRKYGKPIYMKRGIFFESADNFDISNIINAQSEDIMSGSYTGFFNFNYCADVRINDCEVYNRKFTENSGRSTYAININWSTNLNFYNITTNDIHDNDRWGVTESDFAKDVVFENCVLNRVDAHQGFYNVTIKDCIIGRKGINLIGQGTAKIINTDVYNECLFNLRQDYGSFWSGDVYITDSRLHYTGTYASKLAGMGVTIEDNGEVRDYGYELHFPNLYISNLEVDNKDNISNGDFHIIFNYDNDTYGKLPASYWPKHIYINGISLINSKSENAVVKFIYNNSELIDGNYIITNTTLKNSSGDDLTEKFDSGESFVSDRKVILNIKENSSTTNLISLYKDAEPILENSLVEDEFEYTFNKDGAYKIKLNSTDNYFGKTGEKEFEFEIKDIIDKEEPVLKGDIDHNETINIVDVRLLLQAVINNNISIDVMDISGDGVVDIIDVRLLLQYVINNT